MAKQEKPKNSPPDEKDAGAQNKDIIIGIPPSLSEFLATFDFSSSVLPPIAIEPKQFHAAVDEVTGGLLTLSAYGEFHEFLASTIKMCSSVPTLGRAITANVELAPSRYFRSNVYAIITSPFLLDELTRLRDRYVTGAYKLEITELSTFLTDAEITARDEEAQAMIEFGEQIMRIAFTFCWAIRQCIRDIDNATFSVSSDAFSHVLSYLGSLAQSLRPSDSLLSYRHPLPIIGRFNNQIYMHGMTTDVNVLNKRVETWWQPVPIPAVTTLSYAWQDVINVLTNQTDASDPYTMGYIGRGGIITNQAVNPGA